MGFKYVYQKKWTRYSIGYIFTAVVNLLLLTFRDMNGSLQVIILIIHLVLAGLSILMGMHYFNLYQKDYIRIDENRISIHRGPIVPRKTIILEDIDKVIVVSTVIELHMKHGIVRQFNAEWLSKKDLDAIKSKLEKSIA